MRAELLSRVQLFATPWTVARRAPLSMGFSRQEDWSGMPFHPPGYLPDPEIKPESPALEAYFPLHHLGNPLINGVSSYYWASLVAQLVKNPPAMRETPVRFLGWEDLLKKG